VFIAEKGPECFQDKAEVMKNCTTSIFGKYFPEDMVSLETFPKIQFGEKECE
jgi:Protein of unknown function (DUF1397)